MVSPHPQPDLSYPRWPDAMVLPLPRRLPRYLPRGDDAAMSNVIRLCGGAGEGHVFTLPGRRPSAYNFVVGPPPLSLAEMFGGDVPPAPWPDVYDVMHYVDTGILTADGEWLYAVTELLEELRAAARNSRYVLAIIPAADWDPDPGGLPPWLAEAEMSGKVEYPLDAIQREDTERLIAQIDEVTEDGTH
jgi:hypothetical protein